jgi:GTP-binding protein
VKIRSADLLISCARESQFPQDGPPEIAFLGRSNVGKSSLLNALVNRKQLARTSGTPGKTRLVHFFHIVAEIELVFVDLPGYGFAKVSRSERKSWGQLIESYLDRRQPLRLAVLLQDIRREVSEDETLLLEWLAELGVPAQVVITKADKLKPMRRAKRLAELAKQLDRTVFPPIATSAQTKQGVDLVWRQIRSSVRDGER